jgi:hypothetical protein
MSSENIGENFGDYYVLWASLIMYFYIYLTSEFITGVSYYDISSMMSSLYFALSSILYLLFESLFY